MSWVPSVSSTPYTRSASPLSCSYAMSKRLSAELGKVAPKTWPILLVTVHVAVQTYASSQPSLEAPPSVIKIRWFDRTGEYAIRTWRKMEPEVACSVSALHEAPSHVRVLGQLYRFVAQLPVLD